MNVTTKIDTSGLNTALALAQDYTRRTPALACNTAMFFVARYVAKNTPKVSPSTINTELNVTVIPGITMTKGGKLSKAKKNMLASSQVGGASRTTGVPLGVLIMMARMKPGSNYNVTTGGRYAINARPAKGTFRTWMKTSINRMIKARRSSTAFIASSAVSIIKALEPFVAMQYRRGAAPMDSQAYGAYKKHRNVDKGEATVAVDGVTTYAEMLLNIGASGANSESHNAAMHRMMGPVVQAGVSAETQNTINFIKKRADEMIAKGKAAGVFA